ncbi:MAG: calcium/sodium antiporter [Pseudomonadales bacterium]
MTYLMLTAGLILLVVGGELLVRGAVAVALRFGVPPMLIGLTLVGFGTSTPELVTSLEAAILGAPGIAIGNVVGSNTANILLILGLSALIMPIAVARSVLKRDGSVVLLAALACLGAVLIGEVGRVSGAILLLLLVGYLVMTVRLQSTAAPSSANAEAALSVPPPAHRLGRGLLLALGGLVLTIAGADLLVGAAIELARDWRVAETVIGVTIVAVGTSLPELVTSVTAAIRRQPDIAYGNIVGSNIFNVLGILGITALVQPLEVPEEILRLDIWAMLGATALLLWFSATGRRLSRPEGGVFLLAYAGYLGLLAV